MEIIKGPAELLEEGFGIGVAADQTAVHQGQILTGVDDVPVKIRITGGIGDHRGMDIAHCLAHGADQALFTLIRIEIQQRADALRDSAGGHDNDFFLRETDALLRCHDDVLVIGENKYGGGRGVLYSLENVVCRGVHGLAAGDNVVSAQFAEEVCHPVSGTDGHDAVILFGFGDKVLILLPSEGGGGLHGGELPVDGFKIICGLGFPAGLELLGLGDHVLNLGKLERAVLLAFIQRIARHVGVDMDLEDLIVIADDQRITDAGEIPAQRVEVDIRSALPYHIDSVKSKGDGLHQVDAGIGEEIRLGIIPLSFLAGDHFSAQGSENGAEDHHIALAAGIDHPGFLQNGVLIDGIIESQFTGFDAGDERVLEAGALVCGSGRGLGGKTGDGENRTFGRFHDSFVGGIDAVGHGACELCGTCGLETLKPLRDPAEQKGEDDAGISACTAQHCAGNTVGSGGDCVEILLAELDSRIVDGETHVCTGITVRHGEDVQVIDGLDIFMQSRIRAENHLLEGCGINIIFQKCTSGDRQRDVRSAYPMIVSIYTSTAFTGTPVFFFNL